MMVRPWDYDAIVAQERQARKERDAKAVARSQPQSAKQNHNAMQPMKLGHRKDRKGISI